MEKIKCGKHGYFTFRKPNIAEGMRLAATVFPTDAEYLDCSSIPNLMAAKTTERMGFLIDEVAIKIDKKEITTYDKMLEEYDLIKYIIEMVETVMGCLELAIKKKNG